MKLNELGRLLSAESYLLLVSQVDVPLKNCILYKILAQIFVLFEKKPYLCGTKDKVKVNSKYKSMLAIVLKDSTLNRVVTRLRHCGSHVDFLSLPSRVSHDYGFTYLYFHSLSDMCYATDLLYAFNALYRVVDYSL